MLRITLDETDELACHILGLDYDNIINEGNEDLIDEKLYNLMEIERDQFNDIINHLMPSLHFGISPLTNKQYVGFANKEKQMWFFKKEL